jgi:pyrimidine-specific ribonucleoside hydrolase
MSLSKKGEETPTKADQDTSGFGCKIYTYPPNLTGEEMKISAIGCLLLVFLIGCTGSSTAPLEPVKPRPPKENALPVVIDTDMAADDWMAILYLLMRSDVDVLAITVTGAGEAHCGPGTRNALDLAALAGRPEISVSCGRETPLAGQHTFPVEWRDRVDNLLGLSLPENPGIATAESAPEMLDRIIQNSPQPIHLLVLGPLTNVAEAISDNPTIVDNIAMITVMGGAVRVPGNVGVSSQIENDVAEWNIYVDPSAAAQVFRSGAPITLIPLDATSQVPVSLKFYNRMKSDRTTSVAEFVFRVLAAQEDYVRSGVYYFWDPLAAAAIRGEDLFSFQELSLEVVVTEGPQSGWTRESETGSPVRVAMTADRERFDDLFLDVLNGRMP